MSHQWLYPIFRVYGYRPTKVETVEHCLRLHLTPQPHQVCCSQCGNREVIRRGEQVRVLRNYYLKEDLRQIWEQPNRRTARSKLLDWYHQALSSGIRVLHDFARTLLKHAKGILAWYDYPISTGPLEGTNNKIKTLNRQHYGLRDADFFTLKLYQLHETKYALVG